MTERPILFSAPMVRAVLAGQKTQTRRVMRDQPVDGTQWRGIDADGRHLFTRGWMYGKERCPYGVPGDRLWVRESLKAVYDERELIVDYAYAADSAKVPRDPTLDTLFNDGFAFAHLARPGGVPSIHMPHWASRITLEITGVRVERLQAISEDDARAEGITDGGCLNCGNSELSCGCLNPRPDARDSFIHLWISINGAESWDANPFVWVVEFKRA